MKPSHLFLLALSFNVLSLVADAATINVRTGVHDRYNRMVFDWPNKVDFDAAQQGDTVTLTFNGQSDAEIKALGIANLPFVRNFKTQKTAKALLATFDIPEHSKIESFRTGTKIAFDVLTMDKTPPIFPGKAQIMPPVKETPAPEKTEAPKESPQQVLKAPDKMPQTLAQRLVVKPPEDDLQNPSAQNVPLGAGVISIDPGPNVKLAVFMRANHLWVVIDKAVKDIAPTLSGDGIAGLVGPVQKLAAVNGTAFIFDLNAVDTTYAVLRNNNVWNVILNPVQPKILDDVGITVSLGQIAVFSGDQPHVVVLDDKSIGDTLWVVPVRAPETHVVRSRQLARLQFLPTIIGAVMVPQDPALATSVNSDSVLVSGALGLSADKDRLLGTPETKKRPPFRLSNGADAGDSFTKQREAQETAIVAETDLGKKARLFADLARIYVKNGFGIESLGVLRVARDMFPDIENDADFVALRAMASALAAHEDDTKKDLSDNRLQSLPLAKLWLGYVLAKNQKWTEAKAAFNDAGSAENKLPEGLKNRLILAKAETAFETGDVARANKLTGQIHNAKDLLPGEKAALTYLTASTDVTTDNAEEALPLYDELIKGPDQMYRIKAELDLLALQLQKKEMTLPKAIEQLEQLRFSWRGDRLETRILRTLGQYYIDNKQYMEGLTVWRQAAGLPYNAEDTDRMTQAMQEEFNKLYVDNDIKNISPLKAAALFDRFRELSPTGKPGSLAALHLADRLAAADLLDQADAVLSKQLQIQPDDENAQVYGARIASWRLLNGDGAGALQILDATVGTATMPDDLSQRRLLLRARALADNKQTDEGLSLLDALQTPEALSLRADINWRQGRWPDAVAALQTLALTYRDKGQVAPDGPMPPLILKMAIAMALDDNKQGMALLSTQYGDFMAKTNKAEAFALITKSSRGSSLADLDTLTKQVGEVEFFQKFLKDFGA